MSPHENASNIGQLDLQSHISTHIVVGLQEVKDALKELSQQAKQNEIRSLRCSSALEPHVTEAAPSVFGAFGDKDPATHGELWGMVLAFTKAFPTAWPAVDVQKTVMPKLLAFLRCLTLPNRKWRSYSIVQNDMEQRALTAG